MASAAVSGHAADWDNVAFVSGTMGISESRLCVGASADNLQLACPTYAPSLTTAGDVSVTGNLSANKFIGDGSGLTGLASGDRITSGTSTIIVSQSGQISFTTAGTERMVINASGNVGIGTTAPNTPLAIEANTNQLNLRQIGATWGLLVGAGTNYTSGAANSAFVINVNSGPLALGTGNTERMRIDSTGNVGIGTTAPNAKLDVNGGVRYGGPAANGTTDYYSTGGTLRGSLWVDATDFTVAGAGTGGGLIFRTGATNRAKIDVNGNVGIGTTAPSNTLHVSGSARITSDTIVSGTIKLAGTGSESCTSASYGTIRVNPSTGKLELCRE